MYYRFILLAALQYALFVLTSRVCEATTNEESLRIPKQLSSLPNEKITAAGNFSATTHFARQFSVHCGSNAWKDAYATVHHHARAHSIRRSDPLSTRHHHQRLAVSVAVEAGLADRMIGTLSLFYYALFSGRALQLVTYGQLPGFETALSPVDGHVDWRLQGGIDDELIDVLKYTFRGVRGYIGGRSYDPTVVDTTRFRPVYMVNDFDATDALFGLKRTKTKEEEGHNNAPSVLDSSVNKHHEPSSSRYEDDVHGETPVVILSSNRGRAFRLFDSPRYRQRLFDFGLRPETCLACAFHYLFRPSAAVENLYGNTFRRLADNKPILKIGIAVRVGDEVFGGRDKREQDDEAYLWSIAEPYFDCASQIEATRAQPGQRVLIYLISESLNLRQLAKERLGDKILTDSSTRYDHPDDVHNNKNDKYNDRKGGPSASEELDRAMQHAVGQVLAFSMADFHVFTSQSGFGRLGAWLNFGWHHQYAIDNGVRRKCGLDDHDLLRDDSVKWAGMK